jgi:hypothetical protein
LSAQGKCVLVTACPGGAGTSDCRCGGS